MRKKDSMFEAQKGDFDSVFESTTFEVNGQLDKRFTDKKIMDPENMHLREGYEIINDFIQKRWQKEISDPEYKFNKKETFAITNELIEEQKILSILDIISFIYTVSEVIDVDESQIYIALGNKYKNYVYNELKKRKMIFGKNYIKEIF